MNKRLIIILLLVLVAIALIALALRSRGYLSPPPDIKSVSPDTLYTARLFQLPRMIDSNYRITVRHTSSNRLIAEFTTPDESPLDDSVRFIWNPDATALLLAGEAFSFDKDLEPRDCVPDAYLLIDLTTTPASMYSAASQTRGYPDLTHGVLKSHNFCSD